MRTSPIWQVAYAYELLDVDVGGGPTSGGTLVTLSGRGFTRAAARAATAQQRFGKLWWGRAAALAPRCSFGLGGFSTPMLVRDTFAVCAAPPMPDDVVVRRRRRVPLMLALNTVRFDKHAGANSPGWLTSATRMGAPKPAEDGAPFDAAHFVGHGGNFTYYKQQAAHAKPAGGPTAGGTVVVLTGSGFDSQRRGAAACRFGPQLITPLRWESDTVANCTAPAWPADNGPPPIPRSPSGKPLAAPTLDAPLRLALNLRNDSSCVLPPREANVARADLAGWDAEAECGDGYRGSFRKVGEVPLLEDKPVSRIPQASPVGRCVGAAQKPCEGRFEPMSAAEAAAAADEGWNPPFELYAPPIISAVVPRSGDYRDGVIVTLHGAGFHRGVGGGGATRCGFGQPAGCDPWPAAQPV